MSQLAALLREYFERSPYKTVTDLTLAAQVYSPMSKSYVAHIMRGVRQNPAYDKLMAIAYALNLDQQATNRLLEAAGLPVAPAPNPQIERVVEALQELAQTPGASAESMGLLTDGILLMVNGFKAGFGALPSAGPNVSDSSAALRSLPHKSLSPEEGAIDDMLGEILARGESHPLDILFQSLTDSIQGDRWEVKRRVAEALPKLVQLEPGATLRLAVLLREDYHPDYRADIRRRVIEAVPALYDPRPQEALQLLASRERDEVYMAIATVEVLHDLENAGKITAAVSEQYFQALQGGEPLHQAVVDYLRELLQQVQQAPETALTSMNANRSHPERLYRICIQRTAPRLLNSHPDEVIELMFYFLRQLEDGQPAEHQNLRRPVSKALPDLINLHAEKRPDLEEKIGRLLKTLGRDPDIHVRRALSDILDRLVTVDAELTLALLDVLIEDQDPYIRQRAWRTLLQLSDLYPEQATEYYARLLIPTA